jgi:hypothetical protein
LAAIINHYYSNKKLKAKPNFSRMIKLIDEVFATRDDPDQLQVTQKQIKRLEKIHPATLTELTNEEGPITWILMIPTTTAVMEQFIQHQISEKALLDKTLPGESFSCIYLCSATTLPEYRGKGETKKLCLDAIERIRKNYEIKTLFVWPFTKEGEKLAETIALACDLKLIKRKG